MEGASFRLPAGVSAAISLTYDGGLVDQREGALSVLDPLGIRGTFFPSAIQLIDYRSDWLATRGHGHEIGNGAALDLTFAQQMEPHDAASLMREDSAEFCAAYRQVLDEQPRSAALPWYGECPDGVTLLGPGLSEGLIRTGIEGLNLPLQTHPRQLRCVPVDGFSGSELISIARRAIGAGAWLIFAFAGIGTGEPGVDFSAHQQLAVFLANTGPDVLVAPIVEIGAAIARPPDSVGLY
jgi:hypothetical protein